MVKFFTVSRPQNCSLFFTTLRSKSSSKHSITFPSRHLDFLNVSKLLMLFRRMTENSVKRDCIIFPSALSKGKLARILCRVIDVPQRITSSKNWNLTLFRDLVYDPDCVRWFTVWTYKRFEIRDFSFDSKKRKNVRVHFQNIVYLRKDVSWSGRNLNARLEKSFRSQ